MRDDLYEQCSDHMTEKIPSSAKLGSRPSSSFIRSYSCCVRLWAEITSGVIIGKFELCALSFALCYSKHQVKSTKHFYCPSPFLLGALNNKVQRTKKCLVLFTWCFE